MREKILVGATDLFKQFGIRSVTMDDVAREVSVSKKTIYQHFSNKKELVNASTKRHLDEEINEFLKYEKEANDAIHELVLVTQCMRKHFKTMNPSLLLDMKKYYSDAWNKYLDFKKLIKENIKQNLIKGVEEGSFRSDINPEILSIMRTEQVQAVFDPKLYPLEKYSFTEIQLSIFDHFVYGLLTEKGRMKYLNYLNNLS